MKEENELKENDSLNEQTETEKEKESEEYSNNQLREYVDMLQRLQAEFENYKKRTEKEKEQILHYAKEKIFQDVLPFLDSFREAVKSVDEANKDSKAVENSVKGIKLLYGQFMDFMMRNGIQEISAVNSKFDPMLHDCLLQEMDTSKEDGVVIEEFQKGYLFNGKVLRHSKVKVNVKKEDESNERIDREENEDEN